MEYSKSNKYTSTSGITKTGYKESISTVNQNNCTAVPKFKPVLVKDLLQSFEKEKYKTTVTTDSSQKNSYQKTYNHCKPLNNEGSVKVRRIIHDNLGSSQKCTSRSSEITGSKSVPRESQEIVSNKISASDIKVMHDKFTMTSPYHSKSKKSLQLNKGNTSCSKMQDLNINAVPCNCANRTKSNDSSLNTDHDLTNAIDIIKNVVDQLKTFLEQSVQAHEDQASKLKQILTNVNNVSNAIKRSDSKIIDHSTMDRESNASKVVANEKDFAVTHVKTMTLNRNSLLPKKDKGSNEEYTDAEKRAEQGLSIPLIKLVNNESNQIAKELSLDHLRPTVCLPITNDVSYVKDLLNKVDSESQIDNVSIVNSRTPKSLKAPRYRLAAESCEFQGRRRSLSTPSESDITQGSFTMLEKMLHIVHKKLPVKSLPTSPVNISPPTVPTPYFASQWDKRSKRPLKEYMALKMKSSFLVTPEVNWFQSRLNRCSDTADFYS